MRRIMIRYKKQGKIKSELYGFVDNLEELEEQIDYLIEIGEKKGIDKIEIYYEEIMVEDITV